MSVFREFDNLRSSVNRLFGDFDTGLRGTSGSGGRRRRRGGRPIGGVDEFDIMGWPTTSGFWDEDILDIPMLTEPIRQTGAPSQLEGGKKPSEEQKMMDVGESGTTPSQQGGAGGQLSTQESRVGPQQSTFQPGKILQARVNLEELADKYVVTADMPGFDKPNIKLNVSDDGLLTIKGEQTKEFVDQAKDKKYLRAERTFANLQRTIRVPKGVDTSKIGASYENGVLHVNLPKVPEAEKQKQDIQIQ